MRRGAEGAGRYGAQRHGQPAHAVDRGHARARHGGRDLLGSRRRAIGRYQATIRSISGVYAGESKDDQGLERIRTDIATFAEKKAAARV